MTNHLSGLLAAGTLAALATGTMLAPQAQAQSSEGSTTVTQGGTMAESAPDNSAGRTGAGAASSTSPEAGTPGTGDDTTLGSDAETGTRTTQRDQTSADETAMPTPGGPFGYRRAEGDLSAEELTDRNLYVSETDVGRDWMLDQPDAGWEDVGDIEDLVISSDGQVRAIVVDMGGFLGIGEKRVAVSMENLRTVRDGDTDGDYYVVFTSTREDLENAPEFHWDE